MKVVDAAGGVDDQAGIAPHSKGTFDLLLGPIFSAIGALVEIVEDASRHHVLRVAGVDGDTGLTDAAFEGGSLVNFNGLCIGGIRRKQKRTERNGP